jgi:glyoxylase-like metal-dependent hydrolase (beta-lactamase superfamily II)
MKTRSIVAAVLVAAAALTAAACAKTPTARSLVQDAVTAMGAEKLRAVKTITMRGGTGTREQLQESQRVGDGEKPGTLANVIEIVDLAGGRASMNYEIDNDGFKQHRHEVLTTRGGKAVGVEYVDPRPVVATSPGGLFSWGTQNTPVMTLLRNPIALLLAASDAASDTAPVDDTTFNGATAKHAVVKTAAGDELSLYFDPQRKFLIGVETTDTEALAGDVPAQYIFDNFKTVDGVTLPHSVTIMKGGKNYATVAFASAVINDRAVEKEFEIPEAASKQADEAIAAGEFSPITLQKMAEGVYFARAYSHNSLVVEFPSGLTVVEAPYTDAQSATLVRVLKAQFPNKPIRYVAVTHHHSDHIGGVRGLAAAGATILVEKGHEVPLRTIVDSHHTHPVDELERKRSAGEKVGTIDVYEGRKTITDGKQTLELYAFTGSPHADPMVLAYVDGPRVLFQSDLWFPGTGGTGNPAAKQLLESIPMLKLKPAINAGGHGGTAPFAELERAIAAMK